MLIFAFVLGVFVKTFLDKLVDTAVATPVDDYRR
jgi:hypothetical protein